MTKPIVGVLALQGAVEPHRKHIEAAGGEFRAVKTAEQFAEVDAFIIPGGESTTMLSLIKRFDLWDVLAKEFAKKPVWGVCAGTILMAKTVKNPAQKSFALLPITVERNGYGRQLQSQHDVVEGYPVSFIRAPLIENAGDVSVYASRNDTPVWVQKDQYMATTFHPELTRNYPSPMHETFINLVNHYTAGAAI
ncbi:pyridoxal 5'-phosphate synthase glutaminase subunit PdxT [Alphaproteobacteria bacterium]|nr:pyridoxal 5'-phosphate synthase glutaminase subunit PdxT [Alphaproteobacteria bacterium]